MSTSSLPPEFDRLEEIINWTLPGLTMYYRDSDLPAQIVEKYEKGMVFRSKTFVDVSNTAGKPTKNTRFVFASSKAAPLYQFNPDTERWGLHALNCDSYFKVLDVFDYEGLRQILLLHIPYGGIQMFRNHVLQLKENNLEEQFTEKARASLKEKWAGAPHAALEEAEWVERTNFPIGLDVKNRFFPLVPKGKIMGPAEPLHSAIRKMTGDTSDLNDPRAAGHPDPGPGPEGGKGTGSSGSGEKKKGFWSNLFGKKD